MADFYAEAKKTQNKSKDNMMLTENGAVVYSSIGSEMVDFEFSVNSLRNKSKEEIYDKIKKAYAENPELTTKMIFQIGDVREGKGERHIFDACLDFLANEHPKILRELLPLIPEYTRWDHAIRLATNKNPMIAKTARKFVADQIAEDKKNLANGKSISLCAKWMPSIQSKKQEDRKLALKMESVLGLDHQGYRKLLSQLREKLNIIEKKLSQKKVEEIDFSKMSSKQMLKYSDKMKEVRGEDFDKYLDKVASGEETLNAGVLTPADVVHKYTSNDSWYRSIKVYDKAIEAMWDNLKDTIKDSADTIVVRDGSGSMTTAVSRKSKMSCLEVATALSVYCAERMNGDLKDKFITFSSKPEIVDMSHLSTLHDKLELCYQHNDCSNTNLEKTFDLLLNTLKNGHIPQEEAPKNILILSDMEFDEATASRYGDYGNHDRFKPLFDSIREKWDEAGYKIPTLVFWQLNVERAPVPEVDNELGIVYVSGYTTDNLDMVLSGELSKFTPERQLEMILSKERYDKVADAFAIGLSKERNEPIYSKSDVIDMPNFTQTNEEHIRNDIGEER